jgi:hypothetical protein
LSPPESRMFTIDSGDDDIFGATIITTNRGGE